VSPPPAANSEARLGRGIKTRLIPGLVRYAPSGAIKRGIGKIGSSLDSRARYDFPPTYANRKLARCPDTGFEEIRTSSFEEIRKGTEWLMDKNRNDEV